MPGKIPMWGNPTREREILLFSFRKVQYSNKITFPCQRVPQKLCPPSCCTDCTDPYSTAQHKKIEHHLHRKNALGSVPSFFLGNVPSRMLTFLSQAYSKNLSQSPPLVFSMCLAHYPMHSFIILKMPFSLQSVFSPSPTLNPKAKIRSCLFQDQGS
jgi:hypothetical protein